ncbi:MAG TPA: PH domain-containing protein [Polyangiaceae bacterium]|nr:PH domain-containing protein [Polyangiaceae bacterium]
MISASPTPAEDDERVLFDGYASLVPSIGSLFLAIFTLGLWLLPLWWRSRSRHYRLTTKRVVVETGVLGKQLEQVDLYRVSDYTVTRPVGQRLLGTGNLVLRTLDKTSPVVAIEGIRTDVVALYESIRAATESEKARRGTVRVVENE